MKILAIESFSCSDSGACGHAEYGSGMQRFGDREGKTPPRAKYGEEQRQPRGERD
ncbi:hypothetical protein ACFY6U_28535 [Streptomyces sp. NPDC013157]|uniref:hypothetical protein n=1 Tax=Streptomyces sp. NPDC013157 TaxID=3364861 RepID=UPI0036B5E2E6